jgi:hypothetical protein
MTIRKVWSVKSSVLVVRLIFSDFKLSKVETFLAAERDQVHIQQSQGIDVTGVKIIAVGRLYLVTVMEY